MNGVIIGAAISIVTSLVAFIVQSVISYKIEVSRDKRNLKAGIVQQKIEIDKEIYDKINYLYEKIPVPYADNIDAIKRFNYNACRDGLAKYCSEQELYLSPKLNANCHLILDTLDALAILVNVTPNGEIDNNVFWRLRDAYKYCDKTKELIREELGLKYADNILK